MKKRIFALILVTITLIKAIILTGCSNDNADKDLSITKFIDERVVQFSNNLEVCGIYNMKQFILTEEQWQSIRILFDEINWTELENYQFSERTLEIGFMSFVSEYDTLAFLIPERIVYTVEVISETSIKNRYFEINKETVELVASQVTIYADAYESPSEIGG